MFCNLCGAPLPDGTEICNVCGAPQETQVAEKPETPETPETPEPPEIKQEPTNREPQPAMEPEDADKTVRVKPAPKAAAVPQDDGFIEVKIPGAAPKASVKTQPKAATAGKTVQGTAKQTQLKSATPRTTTQSANSKAYQDKVKYWSSEAVEARERKENIRHIVKLVIVCAVILAILLALYLEVFSVRVFLLTEYEEDDYVETYKYDRRGNLLSETTEYNGEVTHEVSRKYNSKNKIVSETEYDEDGDVISRIDYEYDSKGHLEREEHYDSYEAMTTVYECRCDNKGNVIERVQMNYQGAETGVVYAYKYDLRGNCTEQITYYKDECIDRQTWAYNGKGLVTDYEYSPDPENDASAHSFVTYRYDGKGNMLEKTEGTNGNSLKTVYEYEKNNLMQVIYYSYSNDDYYKEEITGRDKYSYDDDGKLEKIVEYRSGEKIGEYKIKTDKYGNIIEKKLVYESGRVVETEKYEYKKMRMSNKRAQKLQREYGKDLVIIDYGMF